MEIDIDGAVSALKEILKIDSVESEPLEGMPFGEGNAKALEYALNLLKSFGFVTKNIENYCGYGEIGEGELFGILAHLDVVPVGDGWNYPPFGAEEVSGRIYGRGAMDDKGPFIAALFACAALLKDGLTPKKRIRFILGCDEESGWKCMERYEKTEEMPVMGFSPDADFPVINCEKGIVYHAIKIPLPSGVYELQSGERANVVPASAHAVTEYDEKLYALAVERGFDVKAADGRLSMTSHGISSHASHPEEGDNALIKLLDVLGEKYAEIRKICDAFTSFDGNGAGIGLSDEQSGALTLNLGTAEIKDNSLLFNLDIRHPISYTKEYITEKLRENLSFAEIEQGFYHLPLYVDEKNPLVVALLDAYDGIMGTKSKPITIGGGTYARFLPLGVAFGPSFPGSVSTIHQKDENISVHDFIVMIKIYYNALKNLCF